MKKHLVAPKVKYNWLALALVAVILALVGYLIIYRSEAANADINGDGSVGILDLSILASHYGQTGQGFATGDLNGDGSVTILDLSVLAGNWTTQTSTSYRNTVMADSPIAYWRFGSTASETGSHNGTLRGSPAPQLAQPGPFSGWQSARFDGVLRDNATTGGFIVNSLARLSSSTWSGGFTLEAWAKTTTSGPEQHVMTFSLADGTARPGILFDDPSDVWKFRDSNVSLSMNGTTTINAWHYLVASVDGSGNGTLYVDGVNVKTWNSTVKPTATTDGLFTVGADYDNHTCPCPHVDTPFNGWIAETAVYNHPLTAARVQAHYLAR